VSLGIRVERAVPEGAGQAIGGHRPLSRRSPFSAVPSTLKGPTASGRPDARCEHEGNEHTRHNSTTIPSRHSSPHFMIFAIFSTVNPAITTTQN